ncbi:MAG TPA: YbaK/EbsC family protein [Candidatus Limnocylindria bacterium]|nr:YbaK/EbsC family protein [Candidatus Limnocylindria bacterium]
MPDPSTPIARVLDAAARRGVTLEVVAFDESTHTAREAADAVGAEVGQIVKSLVFVTGEGAALEGVLVLASGANTVDVARLGAVLGTSQLRRATADEARSLTGFSIGGIPPFGHARPLRTVMDPDLGRFERVWAAAGTANSVFAVAPVVLRSLANAVVAPISAEPAARPDVAVPQRPAEAG